MLDVKKLLKKAVKRKIRITDALIVGFLISGNLLYAEDLTITKDEIIINTNPEGYTPEPRNTNIFNNYGTISGSTGNGLYSDAPKLKVINNYGIISGSTNGLKLSSEEGTPDQTVKNYGVISGSVAKEGYVSYSGMGIYGGGRITVENNGIITGSSESIFLDNLNSTALGKSGIGIFTNQMNNLDNNGVISGSGILNKNDKDGSGSEGPGHGIYVSKGIKEINNSGVISGYYMINFEKGIIDGYQVRTETGGSGIFSAEKIERISNNGIINGHTFLKNADKVSGRTYESGNGINTRGEIGEIINNGTVSGYQSTAKKVDKYGFAVDQLRNFGSGVYSAQGIGSMTNNGVIKGSEVAILTLKNPSPGITNNGILSGKAIVAEGTFPNFEEPIYDEIGYTNKGIAITLDSNNPENILSITNGAGGTTSDGKTIINGNISGADSSILATNLTTSDNLIINGAGVAKGALVVNKDTNLMNSIVNGYNTAVYIEDGKKLTGTDTTFNGGGLKNDIAVIKGDAGNNTLEILGNSIINGAVDLGAGNDNLLVSNGTQINGDLDGGAGTDKLQLGNGILNMEHPLNKHDGNNDGKIDKGDYRGLAIYHEIKNFENIDVKGAVTLYETAKIIGDSSIHVGKDSSLNLRIDPTKKDESGRITGHALYTSGDKTITTEAHKETVNEYDSKEGGTLNIITNGLGIGGVIAMSGSEVGTTTLDPNKENLYVRTDSIIHSATVHTEENPVALSTGPTPQVGDIKVTVGPDLFELISPPEPPKPPVDPEPPIDPEPPVNKYQPRYTQLNKIYKSLIADGDNINAIYPTTSITLLKQYLDYPVQSDVTDMALGNLLTLLNEIYTASPYSFSSELSRESMGLYSDAIIDNPFKAREKEWMIYGGLLHESVDLKDRYYAKNYHGFDTVDKATNLKVDNKVTGAYTLAEYGIDSTLSAGAILGGSKNKSDISNGSNLDGNSFYIGGYFKKDIEELRVIGGIGYQYTDYDAKRVAGNMMQSFSYDNDYSDNGLNIYLSGRYDYALGNDFYLVPKAKLSYTYIDQDSVNEGDKPLAMNVDSKSFDVFEGLIGVDLKKEFLHESGKSALKVGVAYKRILSGYEDDYLTANMKNGSDFDLLVPDKVKNNYIAGIGYEYESQKGVLFNVNGSYSFDVKENNSTKDNSRTKNSANGWSIGAGIGYKF